MTGALFRVLFDMVIKIPLSRGDVEIYVQVPPVKSSALISFQGRVDRYRGSLVCYRAIDSVGS